MIAFRQEHNIPTDQEFHEMSSRGLFLEVQEHIVTLFDMLGEQRLKNEQYYIIISTINELLSIANQEAQIVINSKKGFWEDLPRTFSDQRKFLKKYQVFTHNMIDICPDCADY